MKKYFPHISAFVLVIAIFFVIGGALVPMTSVEADEFGGGAGAEAGEEAGCGTFAFGCKILNAALPGLANIMLQFVALLTGLAGIILNGVVYLTIVKMADNYASIPAISVAWGVVRDVANMSFIFVLLYAAIRTILGLDNGAQKLIVNIIVVAILINFSLFFTKLVIDASNILAILFYEAVAGPEALNSAGGLNLTQRGLSNAFMEHLNFQSLYKIAQEGGVTSLGIITVGLMGSIMLLIAAFVFFSAAIMFIIRYVILIIVLILSPLAFIATVLPALKPQATKWKDALVGQAFFAPIYFMLIWVTLSILGGVMSSFAESVGMPPPIAGALGGISTGPNGEVKPDIGTFSMFINFSVIIAFLIASLIIAKDWANKAGSGVASMTKWAMGAAGGATLGMGGRFGRNTFGRAGQAMGESETLKKAREWSAKRGGIIGTTFGAGVRLTQAVGKKGGSLSFDVRGTPLGNTLDGGKAAKGGYEAQRKAADKREDEYAKSQEPSDRAKAKAQEAKIEYEDAVKRYGPDSRRANAARMKWVSILGNKDEIDKQIARVEERKKKDIEKIKNSEELKAAELAERSVQDTVNRLEAEAKVAMGTAAADRRKAEVEAAKENLKKVQEAAKEVRRRNREEIDTITETHDKARGEIKSQEVKPLGERRKAAMADAVEKSRWAKIRGYNYTAAAQIRKGKSNKDKLAEAAAAFAKETAEVETPETTAPATPTSPPTPPAPPTS